MLKTQSARTPVRARTLGRKASFRDYDDAKDFPYVWAAYRKGAFDELWEDDFDQPLFRNAFHQYRTLGHLGEIETSRFFTLEAHSWWGGFDHGRIPVGLMACNKPLRHGRPLLEPHTIWFPWASARNKLETTLKFLYGLRLTTTIMIYAKAENEAFFKRLSRYQVIRRVGTVYDYYDKGELAQVWQVK